ncbi:3-phosphoglycerate dehydrogenase [Alphaproteobacteria bacterium AO1-B]|nr:3-phosphoglycerate dehydrogenase [Alphaproteobacteria bacterium AO1-B]
MRREAQLEKKVVVSEFMDEAALQKFGPVFQVFYDPSLVDDEERLFQKLADADALIVRNRTQVSARLLDAAPNLLVIGRLGVGLENIDLEECTKRGVGVRPATGANTQSVVEYVFGAMLFLRRGAFTSNQQMLDGNWPRTALGAGGEVQGLTLGLVGFGEIAQAVAQVGRVFGMNIIAFDPYLADTDPAWTHAQSCDLENLFARADVVSLHVPLTPATAGLIGASELSKMKSSALLINTARGEIVDEHAVATALKVGRLAGAAIDVFAQEPLGGAAAAVFKDCPNLILTPHIAGVTRQANVRVSQVTVENVLKALTEEGA